MPTNAFPSTVTQVDTSARFPLGYQVTVPAKGAGTDADRGEQVWVYVAAEAALATGDIVVRDPSALTNDMYGVTPSAGGALVAMSVVGVAQHTIGSGSFGFVQAKGQCLVKNGTADITADTGITSGGSRNGAAIDIAAGAEHCVFGFSLEAEATDNTTFDAYINCFGA